MSQAGETRLPESEHGDGGQAFFTSVGCMDGRAQSPILAFGQKQFGIKYADTITEAGLVGLLSRRNVKKSLLNSIKKKILISLEKHYSKGIIVHGHEDCAGNPVENKQHKKDVLKAAKTIGALVPNGTQILPVFVKRDHPAVSGWSVEQL